MKVKIGNERLQSTGAVCQCGAVFAGMINNDNVKKIWNNSPKIYHEPMGENWLRETHLTNGSFIVLDVNIKETNYPVLDSEI